MAIKLSGKQNDRRVEERAVAQCTRSVTRTMDASDLKATLSWHCRVFQPIA